MKNVLIFNRITLLWPPLLGVLSDVTSAPIQVGTAQELLSCGCGPELDLAFVHVDDHLYLAGDTIATIRSLSPAALIVVYGQAANDCYLQAGAQIFFDLSMTAQQMKSRINNLLAPTS